MTVCSIRGVIVNGRHMRPRKCDRTEGHDGAHTFRGEVLERARDPYGGSGRRNEYPESR